METKPFFKNHAPPKLPPVNPLPLLKKKWPQERPKPPFPKKWFLGPLKVSLLPIKP